MNPATADPFRLVADITALKMGKPVFPWGAGTRSGAAVRQAYLDALRAADQQDYAALLQLVRSGSF